MKQLSVSCYICGRVLNHTDGRPPCEELSGWITVSLWKGKGVVENVNFCSADCLHNWSCHQIVKVPDVFLKSFDNEK